MEVTDLCGIRAGCASSGRWGAVRKMAFWGGLGAAGCLRAGSPPLPAYRRTGRELSLRRKMVCGNRARLRAAGRKLWLKRCKLLKDKIPSNVRKEERKACGSARDCGGLGRIHQSSNCRV